MIPQEVKTFEQRIESVINRIRDIPDEAELQAHWSRYLCILVSGYIEVSAAAVCSAYVNGKAHPNVKNYVSSRLKTFTNANMEKFLALIGSFDPAIRKGLEENLDEGAKEAFDAIVSNRHLIAHGKNTNISYVRVKDYYSLVQGTVHKTAELMLRPIV
jgi:hypothetical protein